MFRKLNHKNSWFCAHFCPRQNFKRFLYGRQYKIWEVSVKYVIAYQKRYKIIKILGLFLILVVTPLSSISFPDTQKEKNEQDQIFTLRRYETQKAVVRNWTIMKNRRDLRSSDWLRGILKIVFRICNVRMWLKPTIRKWKENELCNYERSKKAKKLIAF